MTKRKAKPDPEPAEEGTANPVKAEARITSSTIPATIGADTGPAGHPRDETAGGDGNPAGTAR